MATEAETIAALREMQARYDEVMARMQERHHQEIMGMHDLLRAVLQRFPTSESRGTVES